MATATTTRKTTAPAASTTGTDVDGALVQRAPRKTRTAAPKATAAPVVEAPAVETPAPAAVEAPKAKRSTKPKFEKGVPTEAGCTASTECAHTTYPTEDAHCRKPGCANFIDTCDVHIRPKAIAKRDAEKVAAAAAPTA